MPIASVKPRVVIVGGGITGLAAAHHLLELGGLDVEVFDAAGSPGGLLATEYVGDYLIERGADSFITNKPAAIDLCMRLGLESELIPTDSRYRTSLVLRDGQPTQVPRGFQLLMPTQLEPLLQSPLLSEEGKRRVMQEASIAAPPSLTDESVASFVRRRFGDELFDRLAQPMVGGIYTADPDKLSLLATLPRFLHMEQEYGSLANAAAAMKPEDASGARYGLFVSLRKGIAQLVDSLVSQIDRKQTIHTERPVRSISRDGQAWVVTDSSGRIDTFDAAIVATSAWRAAETLENASSSLATALREIEYASSAVVCTVHRLQDIAHPMDAFGLVIPSIENRRILAVSFASRKFPDRAPDDSIVLRTFVGGAMQPEILDNNDNDLTKIVQEELSDIFGCRGRPLHTMVTRYDRAMPQYHLGHIQRVQKIRSLADSLPRFEIAGNAYEGVGIPDSVLSGEEAARRIWETTRS